MTTSPGSGRTHERVSALPLSMASLGTAGRADWRPNWIDYRSSAANVDRRRDRGETVETCRECGCEVDVSPAPHSPKCPVLVKGEAVNGRELLDRMDAGERVGLEETEEKPHAEAAVATDGASSHASVSSSPGDSAQEHVLQLLERGPMRLVEISASRGCTVEAAYGITAALVKKGLVEKVSRGTYALTTVGREPSAERRDGAETAATEATVTGKRGTGHGRTPSSRPSTAKERAASRAPASRNVTAARSGHSSPETLEREAERIDGEIARLQERAELCRRIAADLRKLEELAA